MTRPLGLEMVSRPLRRRRRRPLRGFVQPSTIDAMILIFEDLSRPLVIWSCCRPSVCRSPTEVWLPVCLSAYVSAYSFVYICLYHCVSDSLAAFVSVSVIFLLASVFACIVMHLPGSLCICLFSASVGACLYPSYPFACLLPYLPACLPLCCLSACVPLYLLACLPACVPAC